MHAWMKTPIVDGHVHLDSHRAIDDMMNLATEAGFGRINIVCVPGSPERGLAYNAIAMLAKARHPGRTYVFGGLQYNVGRPVTQEYLRRQAEALRAMGCDGVKMLEGKPSTRRRIPWRMDDPLYDAFYAYLEAAGIPLVWHVADPESFWDSARVSENARKQGWDYSDGSVPLREQFYDEVDHVLARFPRLKAIFAHFYFMSADPARAGQFLDRWPAAGFDITPGAEMYRNFSRNPALWREFFIRYQDRISFGTDNVAPREPWEQGRASMLDKVRMMRQFLETAETFEGFCTATSKLVTGLGLPPEVLEKIYSRNFERYAGTTPRPLDVEAARRHCRQVLEFVTGKPELAAAREELTGVERALAEVEGRGGFAPGTASPNPER